MENQFYEKLRDTLATHKAEYLGRLKDLIALDTQVLGHGIAGGKEENGQVFLETLMKDMGASVTREPMTEAIVQRGLREFGEGNPGHNYTDYIRHNLIGKFKGGNGRSLIFNGHIDTMPTGEMSLWKTDPWTPTERDGNLYGLGSVDMKSGLMAAVMAIKLLQDAGVQLPGDVTVLSVVDEEGGGNGSLGAMLAGHRADAAVICEHSADSLIVAHMGFIFFQVDVSGVALHSGRKWDGVNAIDKAILLIQALNELEHGWLLKYKHPLLPPPNLNVGVITGGSAGSTVPDLCTFKLCLHYQPNVQTYESVVKEVTDTLMLRSQGDAWLSKNPPKISIYQAGGAFEMDPEHEFVKTASQSFESVFGTPPQVVGSPAGCDARLLRNIGKMPVFISGPGLGMGHRPNEYVEIEEYFQHILYYALLILNWGAETHRRPGGDSSR